MFIFMCIAFNTSYFGITFIWILKPCT